MFSSDIVPGLREEEEEETHKTGSQSEDTSLDPAGSASPLELTQQKRYWQDWIRMAGRR